MRKISKLKIAIGLALAGILIVGGSIFFGYRKSQTICQYAKSHLGYGKSDVDAASQLVFMGDSITRFEDWNVLLEISSSINSGISGDTTDGILKRLSSVISAKPKKLFLMIGINDLLNGKDVDYVAGNYAAILDRIKMESPATIVYVQSVLPINNDVLKSKTTNNQKIADLNSKIRTLSEDRSMIFIDLYLTFAGTDNKMPRQYTWDGLHPNSHGYTVWKDLIAQYIK